MSSKFSSIMQSKQASAASPEQVREKQVETKQEVDAKPVAEAVFTNEKPAAEAIAEAKPAEVVAESKTAVSESKPINMQPLRGKKGHPDYNQVTIYLKKQTQNEAKIALLQARDERDFSELVEDLIANWLKQKQ